MPIDLRSKGGSGEYQAEWYSGRLSVTLSSTPFVISPASGKKIRLESLSQVASAIAGVTITTSNGKTLVDNLTLDAGNATSGFAVGLSIGSTTIRGTIPNFTLDVDESLIITAPSSGGAVYSYSEGS